MDTEGVSSKEPSDDHVARLVALTERKHELWDELTSCEDEELRNRLFDEMAANREELARLKDIVSRQLDDSSGDPQPFEVSGPPRSVGETLRANLLIPPEEAASAARGVRTPPPAEAMSDRESLPPVPDRAPDDSATPASAEPAPPEPEPATPSSDTTRPLGQDLPPLGPEGKSFQGREDDSSSLETSHQADVAVVASSKPGRESGAPVDLDGRRRSAHGAYEDLQRVRSGRDRPFSILVIIAAIGAVAAVAWFLFLRPTGSTGPAETPTAGNVDVATPVVDQIRAVLGGLGYGSILVEDRAGTVYLAGVVASHDDRSAAVAASQALAGDRPLNSSGLTIGGASGSSDQPAASGSQPETSGEDQQSAAVSTPVAGPYIEATLEGKDFVLAGVVPSAALASSYLRAAEVAYSPYVRSELVVDEQLEAVDWLSGGADAIVLLPMIIDGSILIADGQIQLSGRSPDEAGVERLLGALSQITGLPVEVGDVEVTNLQPPRLVIAADAGLVELDGRIPTEEIRDLLVEGAAAAYGPGNVEDQITVDPSVYPALWMYSGGPLLQAMATFPDYELRIDGMAFSGFINGGVTFEPGSATFSGNYAQVLDVGVSVLTRDPSLQLVIEGHTDDRGSDEANLALSQRRAEAVRDYFVVNGIDAARLTAVGLGEAEPIVPNTTEEGRARNRRIQYVLSTNA